MLDFVKRAFRNWIAGILWINVIMSTIAGGTAGHYLGQLINYRNSGGYTFLGILVGIVCGMVTNIICGGFITTILGIEKNTAEQTALLKKHLGIQDVPADEHRIDERIQEINDDKNIKQNELKIKRLQNVFGAALLVDVAIDNSNKFSLENGEEKALNIQNGKHVISVTFDNNNVKKEFDINSNWKVFSINIGPPMKIEEI